MHLNGLDLFFWAAGLLGHMALLFVLLLRRRFVAFPVFTALVGLNILRTLILYGTLHFGQAAVYGQRYWLLATTDVVLEFGVAYEIAARIFRPLGTWAPDLRLNLRLMLLVAAGVAGGLAWLAEPAASTWQAGFVIRGSLLFAILMSVLVIGMGALSLNAGLPWHTHVARIALGFGAYCTVDVVIEAAHTLLGQSYMAQVDTVLSHLRMWTYLGCLLYWIISLWQEAPEPVALHKQTVLRLRHLEQTTASAAAWLRVREK